MEPLDVRASVELDAHPRSAHAARAFIRDFCKAAHIGEDACETAALLTSELVTNAIIHGRSRAVLTAHTPPPVLRVSVQDDDPQLPDVGDAPGVGAESGRGLLLVAALASSWGVERTESGGKAVWFELDAGSA
ncbi:MAG TPA: ATP-binding protein [Mycobacteriales bacterium]|nr:ATP-binding protein [Mycobacteriales bacterium]